MNLNQFNQTPVVGSLAMASNITNVMTCRYYYDDDSGDTILPGTGVQLVDLDSDDSKGPPIVNVRDDNAANDIFGIKLWTPKENESEVGSYVEIAREGDIIHMNAGAAIARGDKVELVLATPGNVITLDSGLQAGIALDKASAADDIIRVLIKVGTIESST